MKLLFLEKCASFPIICANMHLKYTGTRLFRSHWISEIDGMRILFIGILTREVLETTKTEKLVGMLVDLEDAVSEPCVVAGIPIVQAAIGTDQIGRFDIIVDTDNNCIDSYTWQCIPITGENCPRDMALEEVIDEYKSEVDQKYDRILTRFPRIYTHPIRNMETELGNLMAEGIRKQLGVDLVMLGSGSIRKPELGPIVTLKDYAEIFPYNSSIYTFKLTGEQLRRAIQFMLREDAFIDDERTKWFQLSRGFFCEYDRPTRRILSLRMNGKEVEDDDLFTVAIPEYHYIGIGKYLNVRHDEIEKNGKPQKAATNTADVLLEYFRCHEHLEIDGEKRFIIHE